MADNQVCKHGLPKCGCCTQCVREALERDRAALLRLVYYCRKCSHPWEEQGYEKDTVEYCAVCETDNTPSWVEPARDMLGAEVE